MLRERYYYVYILTNHSRTLYTGVTNDLPRRVLMHREGRGSAFTSRYKVTQLVYSETYTDIRDAITREKQIKGWLRSKKIELIENTNPEWRDLSEEW